MKSRIVLFSALAAAALALGACSGGGAGEEAGLVALGPVGGGGSGEAQLTTYADKAVLSWIQPREDAEALEYAVLRDGAWSEPVTVVEKPNLFVSAIDLPSVVQLGEDRWIAHFLVLRPDHYAAYDIEYATSRDGLSWSEPARLNDDTAEAEHGFVTLFDWNGETGAIWLDGRNLAQSGPGGGDDGELVGVELRYARLAPDGDVLARGVVDELACDCCKTAAAATDAGPVLAYRDRTPAEIRDVVARRFDGRGWSAPTVLGDDGWRIEGCPFNGPAIAARGDAVAVAWFTGADEMPRVQVAFSDDAGASFGSAVEVDGAGSFGQADVVLLDEDTAVVSWWRRSSEGGTVLAARRADRDGTLGPEREIARSSLGQPLDVPQLERVGERLVFAWTAFEDSLRVRTAYADAEWFLAER